VSKYLVEVYAPPPAELAEVEARVRRAAAASPSGHVSARYLRSILVPGDQMCFHIFEAPSAEAVRKAAQLAGLAYARIVEAVVIPHVDKEAQ
jgi:Protein of unknown function (DUF4242)